MARTEGATNFSSPHSSGSVTISSATSWVLLPPPRQATANSAIHRRIWQHRYAVSTDTMGQIVLRFITLSTIISGIWVTSG